MRDPYTVLGVAKSADEKAIKSAFRKLAKKFHPDSNRDDPNAATRFNEVNQAYEILGDKEKRAQYDRGEIDADGKEKATNPFGGGNPFSGGGNPFGGARREYRSGPGGMGGGMGAESPFADIFEQAFGGAMGGGGRRAGPGGGAGGFGAARQAADRGEDIQATLKVHLEDVVAGEKVEAVFPNGKRLAIRLPDGVEDGQIIRLRGQGQPSPLGGKAGDAKVTIQFAEHSRFRVEGRDLVRDLPIPLETAVLGGKVQAETLTGRVSLTIPPSTSSGKIFRLRGKGLTRKDGARGDLRISVAITLPQDDAALRHFFQERSQRAEAAE